MELEDLCLVQTLFYQIHFVKDQIYCWRVDKQSVFIFERLTIQRASDTSWHEMHKTFNMGHHLELYINAQPTVDVISLAKAFNIETKIIGFAERAKRNCLFPKNRQ